MATTHPDGKAAPERTGTAHAPDAATEVARLRAELEVLRAEFERVAADETRLRLRLAAVERESEERAVRLLDAETRAGDASPGES